MFGAYLWPPICFGACEKCCETRWPRPFGSATSSLLIRDQGRPKRRLQIMGVMDKRLEIVVSHRAWMAWHSGIVAYIHEGKPCPISTLPIPYPDFGGPLIGTKSFFFPVKDRPATVLATPRG